MPFRRCESGAPRVDSRGGFKRFSALSALDRPHGFGRTARAFCGLGLLATRLWPPSAFRERALKLATARKMSAHAAVIFAFGALALGGAMPAIAIAAFALLLPLAFVFEGRFRSDAILPAILLALLFALLTALFLFDVLELAVAASTFAMALVLTRLFTRQRAADDGLLYLTALLALSGAAALTADLIYAVSFAGFALSATSALTLSELSRRAEELDAPPRALDRLLSRRLVFALLGLSLFALCAALALFFVLPRMTAGAFARKTPLGGRVGFAEQIRLDGAGILKVDPRPALRVRVTPDPGPDTPSLGLHWRGAVFDTYDGIEWRRQSESVEVNFAGKAKPGAPIPKPRVAIGPRQKPSVRLQVEVFPAVGESAVFVPERAVRLERPRAHQMGPRREMPPFFVADAGEEVRLHRPAHNGFRYEVALSSSEVTRDEIRRGLQESADSSVDGRRQPPQALEPAGRSASKDAEATEWAGRDARKNALRAVRGGEALVGASIVGLSADSPWLALPSGLDPRVVALARRLTEGREGVAAKARAIEAHLRGFAYSTELDAGGDDPLAHFLFERRAGHCELFATAMAVMLRAVGIPARVVGGFYGGERTEEGDYLVRLANAHAWVEVILDDETVAIVDPTPPEGRLPQTSGLLTWIADRYERLSIHWQRVFVDLTLWDQWRALRGAARKIAHGFERFQRPPTPDATSTSSLSRHWPVIALLLIAVLFAIALRAGWLVRWRRGAAVWRGDLLAQRLDRALDRKLRQRGFHRGQNETRREFVDRLTREGFWGAHIVHRVTERYLSSRFGMRPIDVDEARRLFRLLRGL